MTKETNQAVKRSLANVSSLSGQFSALTRSLHSDVAGATADLLEDIGDGDTWATAIWRSDIEAIEDASARLVTIAGQFAGSVDEVDSCWQSDRYLADLTTPPADEVAGLCRVLCDLWLGGAPSRVVKMCSDLLRLCESIDRHASELVRLEASTR